MRHLSWGRIHLFTFKFIGGVKETILEETNNLCDTGTFLMSSKIVGKSKNLLKNILC